ncbi:MAG: T9SS type A sorting domain-containing protein, partial [Candidatus Cloacimonetes bacterium]|nr:T9SS type A sorting domain-containing protein [Candidatus Cloacimonadota bacterium]
PTYGVFNNLQWPGANGNASYAGYPMANHPLTNLTTSPHYAVYDYPWYNPVYPESADDIVYDRGTLNLFGSILQMRRGFMRRSGGGTSDNPDTDNYWDIDNYVFGPTHPSTGYDKQYIYDSRLQNNPLPWFPSAFTGKKYFSLLNYDLNNQTTEINNFDDPENITEKRVIDTASENDLLSIITSEINDEETLFKLLFSSDFGQTYAEYELSNPMNFYKDICLKNNMAYILYYDNNIDNCFKLGIFSFANSTLSHINLETPAYFSADFNYTLLKTQDGILLITDFTGQDENNQRQIYEITDEFALNYLDNFNLDFLEDSQIKALSYQIGINDTLYAMIKTTDSIEEPSANIYLSKIYVNGFTPIDDEIIIAGDTFTVSTYPNPFNPTTAIEFYLPEQDNINLSIFNVKGQKIITLHNDVLDKGIHTFIFNGKDEKGNNLSSGIYFMRISGNKYLHNKKIILLK